MFPSQRLLKGYSNIRLPYAMLHGHRFSSLFHEIDISPSQRSKRNTARYLVKALESHLITRTGIFTGTTRSCNIVAQGKGDEWDSHGGVVIYPFSEFKSCW